MTDDLAAIEARPRKERRHIATLERRAAWLDTRSGGDRDGAEAAAIRWLLAALHAEREARQRVEEAAFLVLNSQRIAMRKRPLALSIALEALRAALVPVTSEGEPK